MTECTLLSDRMPAILAGDDWTEEERGHLARCADCGAEWALVNDARKLGSDLGYAPDAVAMAAALSAQLRDARGERRSVRRWIVGSALAAAASIMLAVATGTFRPGAATGTQSASGATSAAGLGVESGFVPSELDSLSVGELREVLDAFDEPLSGRSTVGAPGLGDLTDQELERVLRAGEV